MFGKHKTDVLVVGAGPVGMFTALSLAEQGVGVEVIDSQWRTAGKSYALAVHPGTLELLDHAGLAGELVAHGYRLDTVAFYDGAERRAEASFSKLDNNFPFLLALPQQALEDAFESRLRQKHVKVKWNHRLGRMDLGGERVDAVVQKLGKDSVGYPYASTGWTVNREIDTEASFVVGTDGHASLVRRVLGIDFPDLGGAQYFGVFEFAADADPHHEVRVVLDDDTTNVLWPLGDGHFRWSFEIEPPEHEPERVKGRLAVQIGDQAFPYLDEAKLSQLIAERAPWFTSEVHEIRWSLGIRFESRLASSFGEGRAWLAGDAGHLAGPVGMHSMNVGLREGRDLAVILAASLGAGSHATDDALEGYNRARLREWRQLHGLEDGYAAGAGASDWVRKRAARIPALIPASGDDREAMLRQLGLAR